MAETKTKGEAYEGIAFTFCKVATVALICGRFALPVAAVLCATFFLLAHVNRKTDTRCVLGPPLLVAAFWVLVAVGWWVWNYAREPFLALLGLGG